MSAPLPYVYIAVRVLVTRPSPRNTPPQKHTTVAAGSGAADSHTATRRKGEGRGRQEGRGRERRTPSVRTDCRPAMEHAITFTPLYTVVLCSPTHSTPTAQQYSKRQRYDRGIGCPHPLIHEKNRRGSHGERTGVPKRGKAKNSYVATIGRLAPYLRAHSREALRHSDARAKQKRAAHRRLTQQTRKPP